MSLRVQVRSAVDTQLPGSPRRHRRGLALTVLEVAGTRFLAAGTHLSLDPTERHAQGKTVWAEIPGPPP